MKRIATMTSLAIASSLVIGLVFLSVGLGVYSVANRPIALKDYPKRGIAWGFNMSGYAFIPSATNQTVSFTLTALENETDAFSCLAQFMFDPVETPSTVDFLLFFPHELRNVTAEIRLLLKPRLTEVSKTPLSVSCNYNSSEDATRVRAKVDALYGHSLTYYLRLDFVWINAIFQVNQLEYRLLFPFAFIQIGGDYFENLELYVVLPKGSLARSWFPPPTSLLGDPEVRSFYWNLKSVSVNPTVNISYEMSGQREFHEALDFWAGIFIGLGVPISVSSLIEILKYQTKEVRKKKPRVEKETTPGNVQTGK